jgi:uncharacterized membrane protein (UPF0127 family)
MVIIKNLTNHKVITHKAKIASSFNDRLLGLLNPKSFRHIILNTHFGIHTFFMKTPIDVLVLNQENRIIKMKESLKPFNLFLYNPRYSTIIEMPEGTIKKNHISINDKISIE